MREERVGQLKEGEQGVEIQLTSHLTKMLTRPCLPRIMPTKAEFNKESLWVSLICQLQPKKAAKKYLQILNL